MDTDQPEIPTPVRRRLWPKLLLSVAALLFALGAAECVFRFAVPCRVKQPRMCEFNGVRSPWVAFGTEVRYADGIHAFSPNITFTHWYDGPGKGNKDPGNCIAYRINKWGYRDVEHEEKKPPGTFRILLLGDSFTVGEGTRFEETYPQRLAVALASRTVAGKQLEILNFATPGNYTGEELQMYRTFQAMLAPDMVILQWNTNDFIVSSVTERNLDLIGARYREVFGSADKYRWSALVRYLRYQWGLRRVSNALIKVTQEEVQRGSGNLGQVEELRDAVTANGQTFLLLIFPELVRFDDYPYAGIVDAMSGFCAQKQIDTVNLLPALSQHDASDLWVHETDHHPNHIAHQIAATEILNYLDQTLLDKPGK
ncbi:MAG: hypothetical protein A3K19_26605 [Lentisphaerae bacterium RIFOXYB12_FULL_65_16]|nr:MAG: hypothetical protein A3K18_18280 [Lentisphaerae bacterium RIFOXYA12_64_32]OGV86345.1 MAG: hypothetical protein A3K19_26605 [Lentisphaerae bacterium RIFOXYB12_FULL_65_16]